MPNLRALHLFLDGDHAGTFNMKMDEALFQNAIHSRSVNATLRFYRFSEPCWTVGYGAWKSASAFFPKDRPVIRRITGGGIVKHGQDLTYALVAPYRREEPLGRVRKSYFLIHEALSRTLLQFDLIAGRYEAECGSGEFCFDTPVTDDLMFRGEKAAGGAQKRSQGYLLHQGSVAWPLFLEARPGLDEIAFAKAFACELGGLIDFPVKESLVPTENLRDTEFVAWNQPY